MNFYFDMDCTLARWKRKYTLEQINEKGFFANLPPQKNLVKSVFDLFNNKAEVHILTHVLPNALYATDEKIEWLQKILPFIDEEHIHILPTTSPKSTVKKLSRDDVLIDDYLPNIFDWSNNGGTAVMFYNNLNKDKSWRGLSIYNTQSSNRIVSKLMNIGRE